MPSSAGLTSCAELDPAGSQRAHDDGIERRRQRKGSRKPEREVDEDEVPSNPENRREVPVRRRRVATQTVKRRGPNGAPRQSCPKPARPERRGQKGEAVAARPRGAAQQQAPAARPKARPEGEDRKNAKGSYSQPTARAPRRLGPQRGHEGAAKEPSPEKRPAGAGKHAGRIKLHAT
jgi:hypothetical protein